MLMTSKGYIKAKEVGTNEGGVNTAVEHQHLGVEKGGFLAVPAIENNRRRYNAIGQNEEPAEGIEPQG